MITAKAIRKRTDLFDGPEAKKGRERGIQNERVRKYKIFQNMDSPFERQEPPNQRIVQKKKIPEVLMTFQVQAKTK